MTGGEAYAFALALVTGLLVPVLPATLALMRVPPATLRRGLGASAAAGGAALALAGACSLAIPRGARASDAVVMAAVAASLAVVLAASGAGVIVALRDLGMLAPQQVRGTVAVIALCWVVTVAMFAGAVLL